MAANFRLALPKVCINSLDKGIGFVESCGFSNSRDLILDMIREIIVEVVLEGTFSVILDLKSNLVKFDHIFVDVLTILHGQIVQLVFCITNWVM